MNGKEIDVIGLNETRLNVNIDYRELMIEGYKIFRKDCKMNGGGLAIYVKDSLDVIQVQQQMDNLELLSLEIKPKKAVFFSCLMVTATMNKCGQCYH